jgi:hypothetical protein
MLYAKHIGSDSREATMETLLSGIALAALTGATYIAYKHPAGYEKLFYLFGATIVLAFAVGGTWDFAVSHTAMRIDEVLAFSNTKLISQTTAKLKIPWPYPVALAVACGYLTFLAFLPNLLGHQKPENPKRGEKDH